MRPASPLLLDTFERVSIINLPSRADRRREMEQQLASLRLSWATPGVQRFDAIRPADRGEFPTVGTHGCFLSHLGVLRAARDDGIGTLLTLEDDLDFAPRFAKQWPAVARTLAAVPWSFFYGGYRIDRESPAGQQPTWTMPSDMTVIGAHFFGVRGPAIAELVDYLEAMLARRSGDPAGGPMHVDGAYNWFRREHAAHETLAASTQLGVQRASRTDIHKLPWFDRLFGLREATQAVRRMRRVAITRDVVPSRL